jgi:putative tryptophan/tyrosine transport system substrate-binding protein
MKKFWIFDFGFSIERSKSRKVFYLAIGALLLAFSVSVQAQPAGKVPRIGFLTTFSASDPQNVHRQDAFRQGLRELGYIEGKNINVEYRYAEGRFERLPELAEELVRLKVDVLVVSSITVVRTARKVTATTPIVVAGAGDPIGSGLVASLARPGGNVTGLYQFSPELLGKRLELLKEVVPKVTRFAFLNGADGTAASSAFKDQGKEAAKALGVQIQLVEVQAPDPDLDGAFRVMVKEHIGALITEATALTQLHRKRILQLVEQNHIPAMHSEQEWANAGGLMSYGANRVDLYRRAATYVDKILKGAKPADLPVEQPTKFELVINLKAAKQIGLTIPQSVLYRADKVIK